MQLNSVKRTANRVQLRTALISVADKRNLEELVTALWNVAPDLRIISTGGTFRAIAGVAAASGHDGNLLDVSEYTGQPEMQGGLVKTLDWKIYLGLLSEPYNEAHDADLARVGAVPIDLTVVNFYPFAQMARSGGSKESLRGHIDIGGPAMLRASAKNYLRVATVCDPDDYSGFVQSVFEMDGSTTLEQRVALSRKAFAYMLEYDREIATALAGWDSRETAAVYETD